jgi:hypothetical protein
MAAVISRDTEWYLEPGRRIELLTYALRVRRRPLSGPGTTPIFAA